MKIDRMEMYVSEMRHRYFYVGTIDPLNGNGVMFYGASKSSIVFQNKREPNLRGRLGWESFASLQAETKRVPGEKVRQSAVQNGWNLPSSGSDQSVDREKKTYHSKNKSISTAKTYR